MAKKTKIQIGAITDKGKVREHNEDNFFPNYENPTAQITLHSHGALFMVADGMGGHFSGDVASEIAVSSISDEFARVSDTQQNLPDFLRDSIIKANAAIQNSKDRGRLGMGTTVVCAIIRDDDLYIAHVGDSRVYLCRKERNKWELQPLTRDHSLINDQLDTGIISEEEAAQASNKSVITRALGPKEEVRPDVRSKAIKIKPNDLILLCSDGICGFLSDAEIKTRLTENPDNPSVAAHYLISDANDKGGEDNATAIVIKVREVARRSGGHSHIKSILPVAIGVLGLLGGGVFVVKTQFFQDAQSVPPTEVAPGSVTVTTPLAEQSEDIYTCISQHLI